MQSISGTQGNGAAKAAGRGVRLVLLLCTVVSGCNRAVSPPPSESLLPAGVALRVGDVEVAADYVAAVAAAQAVSPQVAAERISDDVYAALRFEASAPSRANYTRRTVLARRLLEALPLEAERAGESSAEELRVATQRHWQELDRPAMQRVSHAVVVFSDKCDHAAARKLAETALHNLNSPILTLDAFKGALGGLAEGSCAVKLEDLEAVTPDGRTLAVGGPHYVEAFARAAHALSAVGEHSGLVETEFGFHVLLLTEKLPALVVSEAERRDLLREEILQDRARLRLQTLLSSMRTSVAPQIETDAVAWMARHLEAP